MICNLLCFLLHEGQDMPDTFTHIALPALFSKWYKNPVLPAVVLIGTCTARLSS